MSLAATLALAAILASTNPSIGDPLPPESVPSPPPVTAPHGAPQQAAVCLVDAGTFRVTNYTSRGGWRDGTITRSGTRVRPGVVAVDPRVIPLGTKLRIEGFSDIVFIAEDTGGGIKGAWIDIFRTDLWDAIEFGLQYLQVWVITDRANPLEY